MTGLCVHAVPADLSSISQHAELSHRIRAEVIDQALRLRIAAQTEPLRNLIFALAFSQTGLAEAEESSS